MILKKYKELMHQISITPEIRSRILGHISDALPSVIEARRKKKVFHFVRICSVAACLLLFFTGSIFLSRFFQDQEVKPTPETTSELLTGGFIFEFASAAELSSAVGFQVSDLSSLPFDVSQRSYLSYFGELAEITYSGEQQTACYRKSPGEDDISGDYNTYTSECKFSEKGRQILLKGNDDDSFTLAIWTYDDYSYSLMLSDPLSRDAWSELICSID